MLTSDPGKLFEIGFLLGAGWSVGSCIGAILRYIGRTGVDGNKE